MRKKVQGVNMDTKSILTEENPAIFLLAEEEHTE